MKVVVRDAAKNVKTGNAMIEATDMVTSYSARGTDSVVYKIFIGALDNNVALTSSKYTVSVAGDKKTGTVSGIPFGTSLKAVYDARITSYNVCYTKLLRIFFNTRSLTAYILVHCHAGKRDIFGAICNDFYGFRRIGWGASRFRQ